MSASRGASYLSEKSITGMSIGSNHDNRQAGPVKPSTCQRIVIAMKPMIWFFCPAQGPFSHSGRYFLQVPSQFNFVELFRVSMSESKAAASDPATVTGRMLQCHEPVQVTQAVTVTVTWSLVPDSDSELSRGPGLSLQLGSVNLTRKVQVRVTRLFKVPSCGLQPHWVRALRLTAWASVTGTPG